MDLLLPSKILDRFLLQKFTSVNTVPEMVMDLLNPVIFTGFLVAFYIKKGI